MDTFFAVERLNKGYTNLRILDIGTGSGCIAIALASRLPDCKILASDISEQALEIANINAHHNNVLIDFFQQDVLANSDKKPGECSVDFIVSNPPYVRESEKKMMEKHVLEHEPLEALFVPDTDPLRYYRSISIKARKWLKPDGALYFEINEHLADACRNTIIEAGFREVIIRKDIHGKDRFIRALR